MARSRKQDAEAAPPPQLNPTGLDTLLGDRQTMAELDELFRQMKRMIYERAMAGELTHHLGYAKGAPKPESQANHRNGTTPKTVLTEDGAISLAIPRDRAGTFEPRLIAKNARRVPRFDEHVLSLSAPGMTMREIQEHLRSAWSTCTKSTSPRSAPALSPKR